MLLQFFCYFFKFLLPTDKTFVFFITITCILLILLSFHFITLLFYLNLKLMLNDEQLKCMFFLIRPALNFQIQLSMCQYLMHLLIRQIKIILVSYISILLMQFFAFDLLKFMHLYFQPAYHTLKYSMLLHYYQEFMKLEAYAI
jgi:hypothetical protein